MTPPTVLSSPDAAPDATPLRFLKGVGPERSKALRQLGLETVQDLLFYLPRAHEDRRIVDDPGRVPPGAKAALAGVVQTFEVSSAGKDLSLGRAVCRGAAGPFEAVWFRRRSYRYDVFQNLTQQLIPGVRLAVFGPLERGPRGWSVRVEDFELPPADGGALLHVGRWTPVYELTEKVNGRWLRGVAAAALQRWADRVPDPLPDALRRSQDLDPLARSLREFHFPSDEAARDRARRRLAFDEFFLMELAMAKVRRRRHDGPPAVPCAPTRRLLTPFRERLGFEFTAAQKHVINEIFADMAEARPMSRLLLGDVGSGKTAVAFSALLLAIENGAQAALMAPTEILAEQHAHGAARLLEGLPLRWALLTGGRTAAQKKRDREALERGDIDLAIGTHALLEEGVSFRRLGAVVIDEQHRFGVAQRAALSAKGPAPHALLTTATPIPRTLALTLYGDLAVSVLDQSPPGRPGIVTQWSPEPTAWGAVRRAVAQGRQAYVVFPLVEMSERLDLRAVLDGWKRLKDEVFGGLSVGLLHGRLKSRDKEAAMNAFARGETQILCATPVIEVGVDVPNATVMVILNAERFGLAQLHQLRGRVGRGRHASECHLVSHLKDTEAAVRLRLLCRESSGFRLAEEDLRLRGPGEFLGEAQHGAPVFRAGNLVIDGEIIEAARQAAFQTVEEDPDLRRTEHRGLAAALRARFGQKMNFGRTA